jgi:hypothetical protein
MPPPLCSRSGVLRPISTTPLGLAPPRQARIHRHRVRMTTTPEPGRLPSDQPRPCGRSGPELRSLSHLHVPAPHPFACRDPTRPRQEARRSLQTTPRRRSEPCGPTRRFRRRCVSPMSATDLRHEHPANRSIPGCASRSLATSFVRPPAALASGFTWVEHRLTATLQLRLSTSIRIATRCAGFTPCMARTRYRSVLAGAAIDGPSGGIPRPRCFQPRAEVTT